MSDKKRISFIADPEHHLEQGKKISFVTKEENEEKHLKLGSITAGMNTARLGSPYRIPPDKLFYHTSVTGSTGTGKSYLLELIARFLIFYGFGVAVIDPHGHLYHRLSHFCAMLDRNPDYKEFAKRLNLSNRVIPFNATSQEYIMGFNPLAKGSKTLTYQVTSLMEAVRKCWQMDSFVEAPLMARWLFNVFWTTMAAGGTLEQAFHIALPNKNPYRDAALNKLQDETTHAEWKWFFNLPPMLQDKYLTSTLNRLRPLVKHDLLGLNFSQKTKLINFEDVVNNNKIFLANVSQQSVNQGALSAQEQSGLMAEQRKFLGTMLVHEIVSAAFNRLGNYTEQELFWDKTKLKPYFLIVDEFENFATPDVIEILTGARKFGLYLIMAHQFLGQLKKYDENLFNAVMCCARTKAIFPGSSYEDAEYLAQETSLQTIDLYLKKHELYRTMFAPRETTRVIVSRTEGYSSSEGQSKGNSESYNEGQVNHSSIANGFTITHPGMLQLWFPDMSWPDNINQGTSSSSGQQSGQSSGTNRSSQSSTSDTSSKSISEVPWIEYDRVQELASIEYISLQEQMFLAIRNLKLQDDQHCYVYNEMDLTQIKVTTLADMAGKIPYSEYEEFRKTCLENAGCFKSYKEAIEERQAANESFLSNNREVIILKEISKEKQDGGNNNRTSTENTQHTQRDANPQRLQHGGVSVHNPELLDKKLKAISQRYKEIEQRVEQDDRWKKKTAHTKD